MASVEVEEISFELGGEFVLACLSAHHHREGLAPCVEDRREDRVGGFELILAERALQYQAREATDIREPVFEGSRKA
jgi:hypothetical protein